MNNDYNIAKLVIFFRNQNIFLMMAMVGEVSNFAVDCNRKPPYKRFLSPPPGGWGAKTGMKF
jgi:hypothetical protein